MARLATVGFETKDINQENAPAFETGTVRSGAASAKCDSGAGNAAATAALFPVTIPNSTATYVHFVRGYLNLAHLPGATVNVARQANWAADTGNGTGLRLTSGGALIAVANNTESAASATTRTTGTWYRLEYKVTTAVTASTSRATTVNEVRLNGTSLGLSATATFNTANPQGTVLYAFGWDQAPGANKVVYVEDLALNNDQGANQNSWPDDG